MTDLPETSFVVLVRCDVHERHADTNIRLRSPFTDAAVRRRLRAVGSSPFRVGRDVGRQINSRRRDLIMLVQPRNYHMRTFVFVPNMGERGGTCLFFLGRNLLEIVPFL